MPISKFLIIVLSIVVCLSIISAGATLTWFQLAESRLNDSKTAARKAVSTINLLLDEGRLAAEQARPLLSQPCSSQVKSGLSRLAIGIEHVRVINLFVDGHLTCSSFYGAREDKETVVAESPKTLTMLVDDYISPGVPVMVLRTDFPEGTVTASLTTHGSANVLQVWSTKNSLILRLGNLILTGDNRLITGSQPASTNSAVQSEVFPFSVDYYGNGVIPFTEYLRDGWGSLLLSVLPGGAFATLFWLAWFRRKPLYDQLSNAIQCGEIEPWYQPIVDAATREVVGLEVLARWVKKSGEVISPVNFIPAIENSDLNIPLTRHLMKRASEELPAILEGIQRTWHIAFNFSQTHILNTGFIAECLTFVDAFPADCIKLTVELTEREPFNNAEEMKKKISSLHVNGIAIALDDFGTGYANIEYLNKIHIDLIKIDRSFVSRISDIPSSAKLLRSVIEMADTMELDMVAEGVETEEQATWLAENNVSKLQGYLFSEPVPISILEKIIRT